MVSATISHALQRDILRTVFIQNEGVFGEQVDGWQVATDLVADTLRRHNAASPIRHREQILQKNALRDVVENLETVHKLGTLLREENARKHVLVMPVFDSEVSLEMGVKEGRELVLQILSGPTLGKREVLVMRE